MTVGEIPLPAADALDHHHTVEALKAALPGWLETADQDTAAAEQMAAALARQGLALVPLPGGSEQQTELQKEAETSWFGRDAD